MDITSTAQANLATEKRNGKEVATQSFVTVGSTIVNSLPIKVPADQHSVLGSYPLHRTLPTRVPFYYQQITDDDELRRFKANYAQVAGNELPDEYLSRAIVYQFYKGYLPVAGFILNTTELNDLRYLSYLDEAVRKQLLFEEDLTESDFLEITSNWKLKGLTSSESHQYYSTMLKQAHFHAKQSGKQLLLGGSVIKPIKKIQQLLMTRVIYHGPISPERLATVKDKMPLLKLYVIPVTNLRLRAVIALLKRFLLVITKKSEPKTPNLS